MHFCRYPVFDFCPWLTILWNFYTDRDKQSLSAPDWCLYLAHKIILCEFCIKKQFNSLLHKNLSECFYNLYKLKAWPFYLNIKGPYWVLEFLRDVNTHGIICYHARLPLYLHLVTPLVSSCCTLLRRACKCRSKYYSKGIRSANTYLRCEVFIRWLSYWYDIISICCSLAN